jgi:hypothetical protein
VIPTVLLPALIVGRWWLIPIAAIAWSFFVDDLCVDRGCQLGAAGLAALNASIGVALHQLIRRAIPR